MSAVEKAIADVACRLAESQSNCRVLNARIAELEREVEALKRAGYVVSMALLQSGTYHTLCDDETRASVDAFKPRLKEQNKC